MKVFISYTHDGKEYADKLEKDLKTQNIDIWIDKRCIRPGHMWLREIDEALAQTDYVLGVITDNYMSSVGADEAYAIISKDLKAKKARFISLFFTSPHKITSVIVPALQGFNFSKDYEQGLRNIVDFLRQEEAEAEDITTVQKVIIPEKVVARKESFHNLPAQTTPFVGRQEELKDITGRLDDPSCRFLTLVGPGGIGKTRLAIKTASEKIGAFAHGIYFVPLAQLSATDFLVSNLADFLNFSFYSEEDPKAQLFNYLREKEMLIVMDNFEHLIDGAEFLAEILENAAKVKILVTSRERLSLKGEWIYEIKGLKVPQSEKMKGLENYSAVQLFIQHAQRVNPGFSFSEKEKPFVVHICQLIDGLPLAIELASSWTKLLSCKDVLNEIEKNIDFLSTTQRDVPERHRSVRAVFEQSWGVLSETEKDVYMKMSVFRGGFQREAAEKVTGASLGQLSSLVDKSFLQWDPLGRYEIHGLLRHYAAEKLHALLDREQETCDVHLRYYTEFLYKRENLLQEKTNLDIMNEIRQEIENVRQAWYWALECGKWDEIKKLVDGLYRFHWKRSLFRDGDEVFGSALAKLRGIKRDVLCGKILAVQGAFKRMLTSYTEAEELLKESLSIFRDSKAKKEAAFALGNLGYLYFVQGLYREAGEFFQESLELAQASGDQSAEAEALNGLGIIANRQGEYDKATNLFQQALAMCKKIDDQKGIGTVLNNLGLVATLQHDNVKAKALFREALAVRRKHGDRVGVATVLNNLGAVAGKLGQYEQARQIFKESLQIRSDIGNRVWTFVPLTNLGEVAAQLGDYKEAREYCYQALQSSMEIGAIPWTLSTLGVLAGILVQEGEKRQALEIVILVLSHPACHKDIKDAAESLADDLESSLPAELVSEIKEKGKARTIEAVVEDVLKKRNSEEN